MYFKWCAATFSSLIHDYKVYNDKSDKNNNDNDNNNGVTMCLNVLWLNLHEC